MTTSQIVEQPSKVSGDEKLKRVVRKLTLFAAAPAHILLSNFDAGFIAEPSDKATLLRMWGKASAAYNSRGDHLRSIIGKDDDQEYVGVEETKVGEMLSRVKQYAPYDSHETGIFNVRISKLVTPQIVINEARAKRRANVKPGLSDNELFDIAFNSAGNPEEITRQILGLNPAGGAVIFTSYDEDIRLHHPPEYRRIPINQGDELSPTLESVCFAVGGGSPFSVAFRIPLGPGSGTRLILANGIHRTYSLARAGYEFCPMIVCDLIPLEIQDPFADLPREILLSPTANPPLITDYLNEQFMIPLDYRTLLRTARLNWAIEQNVIVLK